MRQPSGGITVITIPEWARSIDNMIPVGVEFNYEIYLFDAGGYRVRY